MADIGEDFELGEILAILLAVIVIGYFVYKALGSFSCGVKKLTGLCLFSVNPTFDEATGATLGLKCVAPAILQSGRVTPDMVAAIKLEQEKAFPGIPKACVDADVDAAVASINREAAKGPNFLQYAVNYWFGTSFGVCTPSTATGDPSTSASTGCCGPATPPVVCCITCQD